MSDVGRKGHGNFKGAHLLCGTRVYSRLSDSFQVLFAAPSYENASCALFGKSHCLLGARLAVEQLLLRAIVGCLLLLCLVTSGDVNNNCHSCCGGQHMIRSSQKSGLLARDTRYFHSKWAVQDLNPLVTVLCPVHCCLPMTSAVLGFVMPSLHAELGQAPGTGRNVCNILLPTGQGIFVRICSHRTY